MIDSFWTHLDSLLGSYWSNVLQEAAADEGGEGCEDDLDLDLLRQIFDEVDLDRSGTVTMSELAAHRRRNEELLKNGPLEAFRRDLAAREEWERRQQEAEGFGEEEVYSDEEEEVIVGRYSVVLSGSYQPRLSYGVRGGLIAVVAAPLSGACEAAGLQVGDAVLAVDGAAIRATNPHRGGAAGGVGPASLECHQLERACIKRLQGLRGRSSVKWVLNRPRRSLPPPVPFSPLQKPQPQQAEESSSETASSEESEEGEEAVFAERTEREKRLMGALGKMG